jgi:hypothetical protein
MFFSSVSRRKRGMQMQVTKYADIFIVGRLYAGLKSIRGLLMLVGSGNKKSFSGVFVSISRMLVCLRRKNWLIRSHSLGWFLSGRYRIQGGRGHEHVMMERKGLWM